VKRFISVLLFFGLIIVLSWPAAAEFELEAGASYNFFILNEFNQFLENRNQELNDFPATFEDSSDWIRQAEPSSFQSQNTGEAYFLSGSYWFNDRLALGLKLEASGPITSSYLIQEKYYQDVLYREKINLILLGVLPEVEAKLIDDDLTQVNLTVGAGKYYGGLNYNKYYIFDEETENYFYDADDWGGKVGINFKRKFKGNIILRTRFNSRFISFTEFENKEGKKFFDFYEGRPLEVNFSGLEVGASVSISF
jgi:hypothetical protein